MVNQSGILCEKCHQEPDDGIYIEGSALYTMQYIISCDIPHLYTFVVTDEVLEVLEKVMKQYCMRYVDATFKSLEVLEELLAMDRML